MVRIQIVRFDISERAEEKMWRHRIAPDQVHELLYRRFVVRRNRAQRVAPFVVIGRDEQTRCLVVPIVTTGDPLIWRPITAWYCKSSEAAKLE
jgi:hypothetical protein